MTKKTHREDADLIPLAKREELSKRFWEALNEWRVENNDPRDDILQDIMKRTPYDYNDHPSIIAFICGGVDATIIAGREPLQSWVAVRDLAKEIGIHDCL